MPRKTAKPVERDENISVVLDYPNTHAVSNLLHILAAGDGMTLSTLPKKIPDAQMTVGMIANSVQAAVEQALRENAAQPPPSDILAMMRLSEYFYKLEGDVAMTIDVPWEIIGGPIQITAQDKGAEKVWNELWRQYDDETGLPIIDIDDLNESCYLDVEINGQWFPLEVWDEGNLDGIALVEPQSIWLGRSISSNDIRSPSDLPKEKLESLRHKIGYGYRGGDLNIQALPGSGIPIDSSDIYPVFDKKRPYQRYAVPHMTRASRNILHRQILEEYRRGTMEAYLSQIWLFTIGSDKLPATPTVLNAFARKVQNAVKNRFGAIIANHTAEGKVLVPNTLDSLLGHEAFTDLTQSILRDLGFNLWLLSGEPPGGRSASTIADTALQFAIARWKHRTRKFIRWCEYMSRKYSKRGDAALLKESARPTFTPDAITLEQAMAIKEKVMPYFMAGLLDPQQALKAGGFDYNQVVTNKQAHEKNADLFGPPPIYNQLATDSGGEQTSQTTGNPKQTGKQGGIKSNAPSPKNALKASLLVEGQGDTFRREIDAALETHKGNNDEFFAWLRVALTAAMVKAFEDGFIQFGGLSEEPNYDVLRSAPQGMDFQNARLSDFSLSANGSAPSRSRALLYAGAVHYAYTLGVQQAMATHGATHWQRILHPELSITGPCAECQADSMVLHAMDEMFMSLHPGDVCTSQAVQYHWSNGATHEVRLPDFVNKLTR